MNTPNRADRQHAEALACLRVPAYRRRAYSKYAGKRCGRVCSCEVCGNRRTHCGPTRQELRAALDRPDQRDRATPR